MQRRIALSVVALALAACGLDAIGAGTSATVPPVEDASTTPSLPPSNTPDATIPPLDDGGTTTACGPTADLLTNASHCGECGHACRGTTCDAGVCVPTVLMAGLKGPHGLALGPEDIYVAENAGGWIYRTSLETLDGVNNPVFNTAQAPRALALDSANDRLYWVEQTKVRSVETDGQNDRSGTIQGGSAIVVAGDQVFFNTLGANEVRRRDLALGADQIVAGAQDSTVGIAVDTDFIYWTKRIGGANNGTISRRVRTLGTPSEVFVANENLPESIAIGSGQVFWTTPTAIRAAATGSAGIASDVFTGLGVPRGLIYDGTYLYWLDTTTATVRRGKPNGTSQLTLARNEPQQNFSFTTAMAVDANWVYWLSSARGTVKRVAK